MTLGSPQQKAGNYSSQVVAAIAAVELPHNQWADLIEMLLNFVNNQSNTNLRIATLQTIGFICEVIVCLSLFLWFYPSLLIAWILCFCFFNRGVFFFFWQKPEILSLRSNEILTAVIHGARKEEPSTEVQLAAIHALYNSLEFVRENFEREVRPCLLCHTPIHPPTPTLPFPVSLHVPLLNLGNESRANEITSCRLSAKQRKTNLLRSKSAHLNVSYGSWVFIMTRWLSTWSKHSLVYVFLLPLHLPWIYNAYRPRLLVDRDGNET